MVALQIHHSVSSNHTASVLEISSQNVSSRPRYNSYSYELKRLVLFKFREGQNWQETASDNKIPHSTVYRWSKMECDANGVPIFRKKGGAYNTKIFQIHKDYIVTLLEDPMVDYNCCRRIQEELYKKFGLEVCNSSVNRAMHCMCYTKKKKTHVSATANSPQNLNKRKDYALKLLNYKAQGKKIVYLDETNYNLHCTKSYGWSKKGKRSAHYRTSSKGVNLQILSAISANKGCILTE